MLITVTDYQRNQPRAAGAGQDFLTKTAEGLREVSESPQKRVERRTGKGKEKETL